MHTKHSDIATFSYAFQTEAKHYTEEVLLVLDKSLELRLKLEAGTYFHFHMCTRVQFKPSSLTGKAVNSLCGVFFFLCAHLCSVRGRTCEILLCLAHPRACDTLSTLRCGRELCAR